MNPSTVNVIDWISTGLEKEDIGQNSQLKVILYGSRKLGVACECGRVLRVDCSLWEKGKHPEEGGTWIGLWRMCWIPIDKVIITLNHPFFLKYAWHKNLNFIQEACPGFYGSSPMGASRSWDWEKKPTWVLVGVSSHKIPFSKKYSKGYFMRNKFFIILGRTFSKD